MAWGPVFSLAVIPCGWALYSIYRGATTTPKCLTGLQVILSCGTSSVLILLCLFCVITRLDLASMTSERALAVGPLSVPYSISPVALPAVQTISLREGTSVVWPGTSDQCWDAYPLCTPWPELNLTMLGPDIQDGFRLVE